ncbi:T9SS type A sorting domain-containing protein, partial [bacterium]|nr:T9SS type A sorting domain-containing protein [bacterium]
YNPDHVTIPTEFTLDQNYPNPFNPTTKIRYAVPADGKVVIKVYNVLGQEIRTLVNEVKNIGRYDVTWDGRNATGQLVSSGIYFYRLEAGNVIKSKKMMFIK